MVASRDKIKNGSDRKIQQECPWRHSLGKPGNRLILLSRQTYEDTNGIVSKIPLHFIFGNVDCLFDSKEPSPSTRSGIPHFSVRATFHRQPFPVEKAKRTAAIIEKKRTTRKGRALERIKSQANIWQRHTQNRAQCIAKRFAGRLDRTIYDTYPRMKTLRDHLIVWEFNATVTVVLEKQLIYPTEKLLYLNEKRRGS